ncbi:MAG: tRNA guanosine(34) transglycosylase Tgt [Armatimonadetes bacterium]|nr:tRNA guanosine(34) transglycosylase Tgt [Armatimonadota bacterium]MDW8121957.1 tRNA guanosine(34) transglycosylase Tgt [Armatimonadota bacterium]
MSALFTIKKESETGKSRVGCLQLPHGSVTTPAFMPVATSGVVKMLTSEDLLNLGASIILSNAYHLHLKPGEDLIAAIGGLHRFMSWQRPILTDSGGFQVFSLAQLRSVTEEGVLFRSHYDGSEHFLTPEKVVQIQAKLGSDIAMVLDDVVPHPCSFEQAKVAMERSLRWAKRSLAAHSSDQQVLGAIGHGSVFPELRRECLLRLCELGFDAYAIGGLSVGEPKDLMWQMVDLSTDLLPKDKPRYLMGVGTPADIVTAVSLGVDLFDCVLPTRMGRTGTAFTSFGLVSITNAAMRRDERALDPQCLCPCCQHFSRAYLHHLFHCGEATGPRLLTYHNLFFFLRLMERIADAIAKNSLDALQRDITELYLASAATRHQGAGGPSDQ